MNWKCPVCGSDENEDGFIRCFCGYELGDNDIIQVEQSANIFESAITEDRKNFTTSPYGRFGYFVMCFPTALFALMFLMVFNEIINSSFNKSIGFAVVMTVLGIGSICMLIQCIYQLFKISPRFEITSDTIVYYGLLGKKIFHWEDIREVSLNFAGRSPFVYLLLFKKTRRMFYRLDASGLKPDYNILYASVKERIKSHDISDSK